MSNLLKRDKGFTLIEVVIVLAIGALIILIVLQAVNSAQKANRDSARKTEAARVVSLLEQYASNSAGLYPADAATFSTFVGNYDANLKTKYTTGTGSSLTVATCPATIKNETFAMVYTTTSPYRVYTLSACLESGGTVNIDH